MDDQLISYPTVNDQITEGVAYITGDFTQEAAKELADRISAGALPFKLSTENYKTISPTLGMGARDAMVLALVIAYCLVAVFMIFWYRLPGTVAAFCLAGQVGIMVAALTGYVAVFPAFTLTLPGIAGIILSIGMGVDSNVIMAERIKEEIKSGKTIDGALQLGYKRAFTAILDGNITVIIVAIILMGAFGPPSSILATALRPVFFMFGPATTGTIYSFGFTLLVGVIANFIMGIFCSQMMVKSIARQKPLRKAWLFGGDK
jgi:protein-export membrane protein SecD